jgi:hypothetical protein
MFRRRSQDTLFPGDEDANGWPSLKDCSSPAHINPFRQLSHCYVHPAQVDRKLQTNLASAQFQHDTV